MSDYNVLEEDSMVFDFSPLAASALQLLPVKKALQFIDQWNGPLRDDEGVEDNQGGSFLLQFLRKWGSIEPDDVQKKLPFMTEFESAFATAFLIFADELSPRGFEQLLLADYPWIRWTAALLSPQPQTEKVFSTLLFMLGEFVEDERVMGSGDDWGYFLALLPRVTLALEAFERPDVVVPKAREVLALSLKYQNARSIATPTESHDLQKNTRTIYQNHLLFLLGRYKAWGAITGLSIPAEIVAQWMLQISLGALHRDYPPTSSLLFYWQYYPDLKQAAFKCLMRIYGIQKQEVERVLDTNQTNSLEYYRYWPN